MTVTTVGYGDLTPTSVGGRMIGILVMLVGIGFLSVLTATIASHFAEPPVACSQRYEYGRWVRREECGRRESDERGHQDEGSQRTSLQDRLHATASTISINSSTRWTTSYPTARPPHKSWMPVTNWLLTAELSRLARPIVVLGCAKRPFHSPQ